MILGRFHSENLFERFRKITEPLKSDRERGVCDAAAVADHIAGFIQPVPDYIIHGGRMKFFPEQPATPAPAYRACRGNFLQENFILVMILDITDHLADDRPVRIECRHCASGASRTVMKLYGSVTRTTHSGELVLKSSRVSAMDAGMDAVGTVAQKVSSPVASVIICALK